jgi:photosystem II stability/assembly factor-like uncharacterized protein
MKHSSNPTCKRSCRLGGLRGLWAELAATAFVIVVAAAAADATAAAVAGAPERAAVETALGARSVLVGAAQAGQRLVAVGERGIILSSDDGGRQWKQASVPVSVTLTAVRFADARNGFAVGHAGTVLSTTDGGQHWSRVLDGMRIAQLALEAAKASGDAAAIRDAERLVADGADKPLLDVLVLDARRAVVVGAYGLALATEDGGATWAPWMARLDNPKGLHLYAIRRHGDALVVAGEQGLLLRSDDAGRSFRRLASPYKGSFFTAEMPSAHEIVVAGLRGNVWRSADAGATWSQLASPVPVSVTASTLRRDGSLVLVNQAGMVLTERAGALAPLPTAALPPLNGVLAREDGSLLALSIHGALVLPAAGSKAQGDFK